MTLILGVDCATQPRRVGLAAATADDDGGPPTLLQVASGGAVDPVDWLVDHVCAAEGERVVLAMDAPLGWPSALGDALVGHRAGAPIDVAANAMFRRRADVFIHKAVGKTPLEVGADRIARTALAALALLEAVRDRTGLALEVPTRCDDAGDSCAIEVYPAATLKVLGLRHRGYKKKSDGPARVEILEGLAPRLDDVSRAREAVFGDDDQLDAAVCLVAGAAFLRGEVWEPADGQVNEAVARREGWIWVPRPEVEPATG